MAKCFVTGKHTQCGNKVSHSHRRSNRPFKPNLRRVRINDNGTHKRVYVTAKALKAGLVERI